MPLLHLTELLPRLQRPPKALLLENVVGFESSETFGRFLGALRAAGMEVKVFNLSPRQLGVPNRRPRIYVLGRQSTGQASEELPEVCETLPPGQVASAPRPLSHYLEGPDNDAALEEAFRLAVDVLRLSKQRPFELVTPLSTSSSTFTQGYGTACHETTRFGPLLWCGPPDQLKLPEGYDSKPLTAERDRAAAEEGRIWLPMEPGQPVRLLLPSELLRLSGFPASFRFPADLTTKQQYKLIGDSINVEVVAALIRFLLFKWSHLGPEATRQSSV